MLAASAPAKTRLCGKAETRLESIQRVLSKDRFLCPPQEEMAFSPRLSLRQARETRQN